MHHGIKGQKWGVRRFQNEDGTLTAEGKARYGGGDGRIRGVLKSAAHKTGEAAGKLFNKAKEGLKNKVDEKLDERNPSRMSDQELREKLNRLTMEKQYKQLVKELDQKPKKEPKDSGFRKAVGSTLAKVLVATATTTMASIAKRSLEVKSDEILAPKRMARAMQRGGDIYNRDSLEAFTYFKPKKG